MAGSGFPLQVQFQKDGNSVLDCFIDICAGCFNFNRNEVPDLTNWVGLNVDRQYTRLMLILWWEKTGGELLGTLMRQDWSPLTFGKEKSKPRPGTSKQFNIPINEYRCVYQKTLKHNFGKSSSKDHQLTVTGWRSGISSAVNLTVHTEFHHL